MKTTKKLNLNKAFRELRKLGYIAEQDLGSTQTSGWSYAEKKAKEKGYGDDYKAVFYHGQDADDLKETRTCHLAWSGDGQEIVKVLEANDIYVEWDGSDNKRIKITI